MQYDVEDVYEVANQGKMNSAYLHSIRRLYEIHLVAMHCIMPFDAMWLLSTVSCRWWLHLVAMHCIYYAVDCNVCQLLRDEAGCYVHSSESSKMPWLLWIRGDWLLCEVDCSCCTRDRHVPSSLHRRYLQQQNTFDKLLANVKVQLILR